MKTNSGIMIVLGVILLLLVVACGNGPTVAPNTQAPLPTTEPVATPVPVPTEPVPTVPATDAPATEEPEPTETKMVDTPAPIEEVKVKVSDSNPREYTLKIVSGLPSGCAKFNEYAASVIGNTIAVTVTNLVPADPVPCTTIYDRHEGQVNLGTELIPGETYTVLVNCQVTNAFTVRDDQTQDMIQAPSPIEAVEVEFADSNPPEYGLVVVSRLPLGSSCSRFNGYEVTRPAGGIIEVTVTHLEIVAQNLPCTADLPAVATEIPLGADFTPGETYKIVVNGEVTNGFTARNAKGAKMAIKASPVDSAEILVLESAPPQYQLRVISRLPLGSSCSQFNGYDVSRPFANHIQVDVTHLEVTAENAPCTRNLPVVETDIPLGSDFESGQEYTVTIGQETVNFNAQ